MVNIIGRRVGIQESGAAAPDDSLGKVFAQLGKTLGADQLAADYKRQATLKLADENELRKFAVDNIGADGNFVDPRSSSIAAAFGAIDPAKLGRMQAIEGYRTGGLDSQAGQRASAGLGEFNQTATHQQRSLQNALALKDREEATKLTLADNLPETVMVEGVPTIVPRSQAYGAPAVQSSDQVKAQTQQRLLPTIPQERQQDFAFGAQSPGELGVASVGGKTVPAFVRQGGIYGAQDGQRIEQPVESFGKLTAAKSDDLNPSGGDKSKLLETRVSSRTAMSAIDNLDKLLSTPTAGAAIGVIGQGASMFNNLRAQVESASKLISPGFAAEANAPGVQQAVDGAMSRLFSDQRFNSRAQALGVEANVLRSQVLDLAYTLAKAKGNTNISNQDINHSTEIIGGSLMDPIAGRQVLANIRGQIEQGQGIREQEYERMFGAPQGAQPASAAPHPGVQKQDAQPRQAPDGNFYVPDPQRPGKYLMVKP
ncbi:hypothetical protein [Bosea sp. PAMC 26642]|uniref:hypothetical protein n=1 Tax=Bosea sp. (strain PAMC 26642) TaxID=1792307 RepID=UPI0007701A53|nr:hypothetical protein [Bosea sp. PAMC 26642]AMJ63256.1 hypothetical protein AXW83_25760 [Bosea sp. PAMC 26642]